MNAWRKCDRALNRISWAVLGAYVVYAIVRLVLSADRIAGIDRYANYVIPVLLAGAVGYITNWLALWYLFKPYEPRFFGYVHGIIPRQKREMAVSLGNMVGKKLLNPDALVEEMKGEVLSFVNDTRRMARLRDWIQRYLVEHEAEIVEFVSPFVERQVLSVIDGLATDDTWAKIWNEGILPRIKGEGSRRFIVEKLVEALRENAGGIIEEVRGEMDVFLRQKLKGKFLLGVFDDRITNYVMNNFADYGSMKAKLDEWLTRDETQAMLREKLLAYADQLTVWMKGEEGQKVMGGIVRELRVRGKRYIATYLRENVPMLIDRAFSSDKLRGKLEKDVLPKVGVKVAQLIGENKQAILDRLRLEQRVADAVDGMPVATFHQTLNEFLSENLCAVQVLGFVLGALVGLLQVLPPVALVSVVALGIAGFAIGRLFWERPKACTSQADVRTGLAV